MRLVPLLLIALLPTALAAEPGGFFPVAPWIVSGPVMVSAVDDTGLPCVEQTTGTIYAWVEWNQANFQLSLAGGCGQAVTFFHGKGNIWNGWTLSAYLPQFPTSGTLEGFESHWNNVGIDMTQSFPQGGSMRVVGEMIVIF